MDEISSFIKGFLPLLVIPESLEKNVSGDLIFIKNTILNDLSSLEKALEKNGIQLNQPTQTFSSMVESTVNFLNSIPNKTLPTDSDQNLQSLNTFVEQFHLDVAQLIEANKSFNKHFELYQQISKGNTEQIYDFDSIHNLLHVDFEKILVLVQPLQGQIKQLKDSSDLKTYIQRYDKSSFELKQKINQLTDENNALKSNTQSMETRIKELETLNNSVSKMSEQEVNELKNKVTTLENTNQLYQIHQKEDQDKISEIQQKLTESEAENKSLQNEFQQSSKYLNEIQKRMIESEMKVININCLFSICSSI